MQTQDEILATFAGVRHFQSAFDKWIADETDDGEGEPESWSAFDEARTDWAINGQDMLDRAVDAIESIASEDAHGTRYEPWTNGYAVGFKCTKGERVEYLYFNPSSDSDDGVSNVFVYHGSAGDTAEDPAYTHYDLFEEGE